MFSSSIYDRPIVHGDYSSKSSKKQIHSTMDVEEQLSTPTNRRNPYHVSPARSLHDENEVIFSNGFDPSAFHPPVTRKVTKVVSKENYSLSNGRSATATPASSVRSAAPAPPPLTTTTTTSAAAGSSTQPKTLTSHDVQRLKQVRRHEPAQLSSGSGLITPESWRKDPVVIKSAAKKKPVKPVVETPPPAPPPPAEPKPKRKRSPSKPKPPVVAEVPKPPAKPERTQAEKNALKKYIEEGRKKHDESVLKEKQQQKDREKQRKEKLKVLSEETKKAAQQPLPVGLVSNKSSKERSKKKSENSDEKERRMLELLGPKNVVEDPRETHNNTPFEQLSIVHERSASSSSSSSSSSSPSSAESIVELQAARENDENKIPTPPPIVRRRSQMTDEQNSNRRENLLRWALNLTHGCNDIQTKIQTIRPDGTQRFDVVSPSHEKLQNDTGNLRIPSPIRLIKPAKVEEKKLPSKFVRPSGRLTQINRNLQNELNRRDLPGIGNLRDPSLEQLVRQDRAAARIQAVYRGYAVRKSMHWIRDRPVEQTNKRVTSSRKPLRQRDLHETPATSLNLRFSDENFTFGSTLLRKLLNKESQKLTSTSILPSRIVENPTIERIYSDDYESPSSTSSVSSNNKRPKPKTTEKPLTPRIPIQPKISKTSTVVSSSSSSSSSSSTTPVASPRIRTPTPTTVSRRRSISPPLQPMISADNGRPIVSPRAQQHRVSDERRYSPDALERQLNAELHLLDGVEASMKQLEDMERLRSVTSARQEVVSLVQILQNRKITEPEIRRPSPQPIPSSSSSSTSTTPIPKRSKRRTPSPTSSSSSESTASAKRRRAIEENRRNELEIYQKRLESLENKLQLLTNRAQRQIVDEPVKEVKKVKKPEPIVKPSRDSSISEDLPIESRRSSIHTITRKTLDETTSEIKTETFDETKNDDDDDDEEISSVSNQYQSDFVVSDASEIQKRIKTFEKQLKDRKTQVDQLKKQRNKEALKLKEEELKKKLEDYDKELKELRLAPSVAKVEKKSPIKERTAVDSIPPKPQERIGHISIPSKPKERSSSSSNSSSTSTKHQESSIGEDLPPASTTNRSASDSPLVVVKAIETKREVETKTPAKKERDFFDDSDDEKPMETPRDERDTQHDALSISIATDVAATASESESEKQILNFNQKVEPTPKEKDKSSSSTVTSNSSKQTTAPIKPNVSNQKANDVQSDYDDDFSTDSSRAPVVIAPVKTETDVRNNHDEDSSSDTSRSPVVAQTKKQIDVPNGYDDDLAADTNQTPVVFTPTKKQVDVHKDHDEDSSTDTSRSPAIVSPLKKQANALNDYDDDFATDTSQSPVVPTPAAEPIIVAPLRKLDSFDDESIQEDLEEKHTPRKSDESLSSKSSGDEQSEILVLVKKSANTTPRRIDEEPIVDPTPIVAVEPIVPNDDTSHDVTDDDDDDDEDEDENDDFLIQEQQIDRITDDFLRRFIDEAIDQSREIDRLKKQSQISQKIPLTKAVQEWLIGDDEDEDSPSDDEDDRPRIPRATISNNANEFQLDFSPLDDKNANEPRVESPRKINVEETIKPLVPHTREQVVELCDRALDQILDENDDFTDRGSIRCSMPNEFYSFQLENSNFNDENETLRVNHRAYCQMIVDLSADLLHEMVSPNVQAVRFPEWQKTKLISKRFFRSQKPQNRQEIKNLIKNKTLEILNLTSRSNRPSKWRVSANRNPQTENFEIVLEDEIRRTESQWLQYDEDLLQVKFDTADAIFDQLVHETIAQCLAVVEQRRIMNSHRTRL